MNIVVRRAFQSTPILRDLYRVARSKYHRRRIAAPARAYFTNANEYLKALDIEDGAIVELHTTDGLVITIRRNYMDAVIVAEVFLDKCYVTWMVTIPDRPTVVDVGGYIGDFALFAVKYLNAQRVIVCEPSPSNWTLLQKNVATNNYGDRIKMVNMAVTSGEDVLMNVDAPDRGQARVSAYADAALPRRLVRGVSLASLMEIHGVDVIDLLKIDCEGGEYAILNGTPLAVLNRVRNLVFEFHEIGGFEAQLAAVKERLAAAGFALFTRGDLVFATRASAI
jgi:FkbM family methyltransferase